MHPFLWLPSGVVSSLEDLSALGSAPAQSDVSFSVNGKDSGHHHLTVAELADGKIIGDLRLVATADDVVVGGLQSLFGCAEARSHYLLHRRRLRMPKYRQGTALLLGSASSDNYYHWLLDSLPRWKMLQAAKWLDYDFVLLDRRPSRFQDEILDRLKVPPEKRLRCSKNFVHQFERLVVPAMPAPLWQVAPWACEWVRSLFPEGNSGPEKIYLSRHGTKRRRLVNETELETQLAALGFACVQPELLSVAEQAKLVGAARYVVAPHGAGLANLVFAPRGAKVIELLHPENQTPCYKHLALARGLHYTSLVGARARGLAAHNRRDAEFTIEIADVLRLLAGGG